MMPTARAEIRRAETQEEIQPLVELCKAGKLFEVQEWIAAGKVVNPPIYPNNRARRRSPLEIAIERGFHSLVKVLLQGGAGIESTGYDSPMDKCLQMRRFDLVQLLVEHGYDAESVSMEAVFSTWDPEIMEYFIERGADVEQGNPLASALCSRIRTALRIFKRYKDRFSSFQEQANIALRHHCKQGNMKWVSLMLWAGADPYAPGTENPNEELEPDDSGISALGFAALYDHFEVFGLKSIRLNADHPVAYEIMRYADSEAGADVMRSLLQKGMNPNDQENGGCSAIQTLLDGMSIDFSFCDWSVHFGSRGIDSDRSREKIKLVHLLAKHGARWVPMDTGQVNSARRSLLKLAPDYTVEFVWIMAKYRACSREAVQQLLRTPTMKKHTSRFQHRLAELVSDCE